MKTFIEAATGAPSNCVPMVTGRAALLRGLDTQQRVPTKRPRTRGSAPLPHHLLRRPDSFSNTSIIRLPNCTCV
jgi:hypothetical protein